MTTQLDRIELKIDRLTSLVLASIQGDEIIMADLSALTASVAKNTSVVASALALIQGLSAQLAAAGTDPVALAALQAQLDASDTALADAVAANTPAAPVSP